MNNEDQKIREILNAYAKTEASESFVQNVMRKVRQEPAPVSFWNQWFTLPRLVIAGAGVAAALFFWMPPGTVGTRPLENEATVMELASLTEDESDTETETGNLIEAYFL